MALALGACSFATDALWPSLSGDDPAKKSASRDRDATRPAAQVAADRQVQQPISPPPPALGTTNFQPPPVTPGQPTGSFVGQKVVQFRDELGRMQSEIRDENGRMQQIRGQTTENSRVYHSTLGAIQARLQVGTTPGNPELVNHWNAAQAYLERIGGDVTQMNTLATTVSNTSSLAAYLLESTRAAYGLSGALDEDHRQLAILEDEVNRTVVLIDRLLNELSEDISRQSNYLGNERRNLTTLSLAIKNGELYGSSLSNRAFASSAMPPSAAALQSSARTPRRPLVVIRFDRPNVQYQQALYTSVSQALERRPDAGFDLVAVAPSSGTPARVTLAANTSKRNAETVLRSLADMGLPLDRVRLSAMTSAEAGTSEVHIYVR